MRCTTSKAFRSLIRPICIGLLISACSSQHAEIIYSTSFTDAADTRPWNGITNDNLIHDPSAGGIVQIAGGCLQPAATLSLRSVSSGAVHLRCRARIAEGLSGASLHLVHETTEESVRVDVVSPEWTWLESGSLWIFAGDSLRVDVGIGGIVPGVLQIDELTLELR